MVATINVDVNQICMYFWVLLNDCSCIQWGLQVSFCMVLVIQWHRPDEQVWDPLTLHVGNCQRQWSWSKLPVLARKTFRLWLRHCQCMWGIFDNCFCIQSAVLLDFFFLLQGAFTCGWCIWSYAFRLMWVILLNNCQHYIHHTCVLTWGDVRVVLPGERGAWKHYWKKQCRLSSSSWTSLEPSSLRATVSVKVEWYSVHCTCQRIFTGHVLLLCWWAVYYDACAFLPLKRITWPKTNLLISHMPRMGHEQQNRVADVNCDNRQRSTGHMTMR